MPTQMMNQGGNQIPVPVQQMQQDAMQQHAMPNQNMTNQMAMMQQQQANQAQINQQQQQQQANQAQINQQQQQQQQRMMGPMGMRMNPQAAQVGSSSSFARMSQFEQIENFLIIFFYR